MCHNQRLLEVQCSRLQVASAWPTELALLSLGRAVLRLDIRFFSFGDFPEPRRLARRCYCAWRHCFPSGTLTKESSAGDCTEHPGRAFIPFRSWRLVVDSTIIHSFVTLSRRVTAGRSQCCRHFRGENRKRRPLLWWWWFCFGGIWYDSHNRPWLLFQSWLDLTFFDCAVS